MKSVCYDDNNNYIISFVTGHDFWFIYFFLLLFHCFFSNMYEAEWSLDYSLIVHFLENIPCPYVYILSFFHS